VKLFHGYIPIVGGFGGFRLGCRILPKVPLLHCLRFRCCISFGSVAAFSLGSVASLDWVRTLHVIRFVCCIAVGSDGSLEPWCHGAGPSAWKVAADRRDTRRRLGV